MQAVILAAGEGSRMRPLTECRPKPMIPIANKPMLEHLVYECSQAGIHDFVFIVGYKDEVIMDYFGDGSKWNVNIGYKLQQKAMGTADALRLARDIVDEKFLVMNGDIIVKKDDIARLLKTQRITLTVKELGDITGLGLVEVSGGLVRRIIEKPERAMSGLANAGVYLLTEQVFSTISQTPESQRGEYELTRSLQMLIQQGVEVGYQNIDFWLNLSYPWELLEANESLLRELVPANEGTIEDGARIEGSCVVGKGSCVRSGSYIIGPAVIGRNCEIGPNCFIRPSSAIGDGCHIGAAVEIKNSIIMANTKIPHLSYIGDSIIGENCNLGAGTKIANLRFNHQNVVVGGVDTGKRKFGAILGNNVQTGINVSINAGSVLGDGAMIWPGMIASGTIGSNTVVRPEK